MGILLLGILALPVALLYFVYQAWIDESVMGAAKDEKKDVSNNENGNKGVYTRTVEYRTIKERLRDTKAVLLTRLGSVFLLWLPVTVFVPSLKDSTVLGSAHWKWTLFAITFCWVHLVAGLFIFAITDREVMGGDKLYKENYKLEYYVQGLFGSSITLTNLGLVLAVWLVYFRSDQGLKNDDSSMVLNDKVVELGTSILVSLFFGGILWVVERFLLLSWKAHAIYGRFKSNILMAGFQLYFLTLVTDGNRYPTSLMPWWNGKVPKEGLIGRDSHDYFDHYHDDCDTKEVCKLMNHAKRSEVRTRDYMSSQHVTLFQLHTAARLVTDLAKVTTREDDGTAEVERKWRKKIQQHVRLDHTLTKEDLEKGFDLDPKDAELLYAELKTLKSNEKEDITYANFIKWMVDSHQNCLMIGYTLVDSEAAAISLNRVMATIIVIAVIFLWLFITEFATIKFLLLIVPPILALSFVFGETARSFFQGIIFCFVTHPFDVGDRCIIDGIEMEVKRIGILTTMFKKMGSKEQVLYPNLGLATKSISNLQAQPDADDEMEMELDYIAGRIRTTNLLKKIEEFICDNNDLYESRHLVIVKTMGDKIKIVIQFTHKMGNSDVTHSQYFYKKTNQRSYLLTAILDMIEDRPNSTG